MSGSLETGYENTMIIYRALGPGGRLGTFWRVEVDPEDETKAVFKQLFTLQMQQDLLRFQVFDDFAIVHLVDHSIYFIIRPDELGSSAQYGYDLTVGDGRKSMLLYF